MAKKDEAGNERKDGQPVTKEDLKKSEPQCPICGKSVHDCPGYKKGK
jgi:hypothetical protein